MRLIELRRKKGISQVELAGHLQMAQNTYQHYEAGRSEPSIDTLVKLADYYNVSLDYLVGRERADDIGFLTHEQATTVQLLKQLNYENLMILNGRILAMLENQK